MLKIHTMKKKKKYNAFQKKVILMKITQILTKRTPPQSVSKQDKIVNMYEK